jgi:hypothetical protein
MKKSIFSFIYGVLLILVLLGGMYVSFSIVSGHVEWLPIPLDVLIITFFSVAVFGLVIALYNPELRLNSAAALKSVMANKNDPLGIIMVYFSYYLLLAFPVNAVVFITSEINKIDAFYYIVPINFILLAPFGLLGIIRGAMVLTRISRD